MYTVACAVTMMMLNRKGTIDSCVNGRVVDRHVDVVVMDVQYLNLLWCQAHEVVPKVTFVQELQQYQYLYRCSCMRHSRLCMQ